MLSKLVREGERVAGRLDGHGDIREWQTRSFPDGRPSSGQGEGREEEWQGVRAE